MAIVKLTDNLYLERLIEAFDLQEQRVRKLTVVFEVGTAVIVQIERFANSSEIDKLMGTLSDKPITMEKTV